MMGILRCVSENNTGCRISFKELCEKKDTLRKVAGKISSSIQETHPLSQSHLRT